MSFVARKNLSWQTTAPAANAANGTIVSPNLNNGGGVVYGIQAINLGASPMYLMFFNPALPTATITYADLQKTFLIPASGALIINPLSGAPLLECPDNLVYAVSSTPTSFTNATAGALVSLDWVG